MNTSAPITNRILQGRRVLVVEDGYMIAQDIAETLADVGAKIMGPVARVKDALSLIVSEPCIGNALLDVNLSNETVWPVTAVLLACGIPLVLATGYDASEIPSAYIHLPRHEKPATGRELTLLLAQILARAAPLMLDKGGVPK